MAQAPEDASKDFAFDFSARRATPSGAYGTVSEAPRAKEQVFAGTAPDLFKTVARQESRVQVADANGEVVAAGNGAYQLNFEDADVAAVAKAIFGDILRANYVIDKRVTGQVTLTSSQPIPRSRLVPLLESSLASIGASVVKDQDVYRVVPSADTGGLGAVDYRGAGEGFGTSVITAHYMPAATLGHLLEGFGSRAGSVRVDAATNLVIVQGSMSERRAALDAASAVDVDWLKSKSVAILPVVNSAPETIITELNRILESGEGGLSQNSIQLEPISRLNAVLVVARQRDRIDTVRRWVARLDKVDASAAGVKVYRLQYAQAKTVAAALNQLFGSGGGSGALTDKDTMEPSSDAPSQTGSPADASGNGQSGAGASGTGGSLGSQGGTGLGGAGGSAGTSTPFGALKAAFTAVETERGKQTGPGGEGFAAASTRPSAGQSRVRVTADPASNSLFINASASDYRLIERTIRQIDRQPVQVAIEATIAEVTLTQDLQYGIQFFLQKNKTSLGLGGAAGIPVSSLTAATGGSLVLGGLSNPRVLLDALQSFTTVKILSSPSLVVLDRQPAVLQVGDQVPILTRTAQSVDNTSAPVVNNVDYKDTGIILNVLPRVNANGIVMLDVEQQISAVTSTDPTTLTPTISQRRVKSSVAVANGQTVMLGGLISDKQSSNRSGLPGLTSIQFISDILSNHDNARDRTEIIIFIKPQIISNAADAQQITEEFHDRLSSMRREAKPAVLRNF